MRSIGLDWSLVDFQDVDDKVGNGFTIVLKKGTLTGAELDDIEGRTEKNSNRQPGERNGYFSVLDHFLVG